MYCFVDVCTQNKLKISAKGCVSHRTRSISLFVPQQFPTWKDFLLKDKMSLCVILCTIFSMIFTATSKLSKVSIIIGSQIDGMQFVGFHLLWLLRRSVSESPASAQQSSAALRLKQSAKIISNLAISTSIPGTSSLNLSFKSGSSWTNLKALMHKVAWIRICRGDSNTKLFARKWLCVRTWLVLLCTVFQLGWRMSLSKCSVVVADTLNLNASLLWVIWDRKCDYAWHCAVNPWINAFWHCRG